MPFGFIPDSAFGFAGIPTQSRQHYSLSQRESADRPAPIRKAFAVVIAAPWTSIARMRTLPD
jgi:hypothetical protein